MKHFAIVAVFVVILTFLINTLLLTIGILPVQATTQAVIIDRLFNVHFFFISFLFSLITVFMVYSFIVFRQKPGDKSEGAYFSSNNRLEVFWTLIPLGIVIYISYLGSVNLAEIMKKDPNPMQVNVTAGQWYWSFEYPQTGVISKSLNLPVNQPILLRMTSKDVIHSFWVPEFRLKQDVLPGENLVKEMHFTPDRIGTYTVRCAELCGGAHAYMEAPVVVMSQADFDTWMQSESNTATQDPAARGQKVVSTSGCVGCHSIDGKQTVGPTWKGLFGEQVTLSDGSAVTADEAYLHEAIVAPNNQVVKGFPPGVMPQNYKSSLTDQQIADVIEYIKTLK